MNESNASNEIVSFYRLIVQLYNDIQKGWMYLKQEKKPYLWLIGINLFISAFTFGGGYVVVPMIRRYFVTQRNCFAEEELINMAAVAQSTPGAIAVNLSALAGFRVAGIGGAVISCVSAVIPPLIILGIVSAFYGAFVSNAVIAAILKGMQAGVAALIVDLIIDMCQMILKERSLLLSAMIPGAFLASFVMGINVALILIFCCLLCIGKVLLAKRKKS
jgi:chromate transporter